MRWPVSLIMLGAIRSLPEHSSCQASPKEYNVACGEGAGVAFSRESECSMETTFKRLLPPLLLLLLLTLPVVAQAQFIFTTNDDNTITITDYTGTNTVVMIPSTITGLTVASIGTQAFFRSRVTSVTIPSSVTCIGDSAFDQCTSLTSVAIGTNVISIGANAFNYCISLTSVTIPSGVRSEEHTS